VADTGNNAVKEIVAVGGSIPSNPNILILGSGFNQPAGVAVDGAGNVYVADFGNNAVKEIVAVGGIIPASSPTILTLGSGFSFPFGVAVDGVGNVYVADFGNSAVKEIPLATPPSLSFASTNVGSTSSDSPQTLLVQNIGNAALTFLPSTGTDPSISTNFVLGGSSSCPLGTTGSPGSLAAAHAPT
jgi:large repetitive protein